MQTVMAVSSIDSLLQKHLQTEIEKNRALLQGILDVTIHLSSWNLPIRGKTKELDDIQNGNFLGTLELLVHYDPLLEEHLQKVREKKKGTRLSHYLSSDIQNKFIQLCGRRVLNTILKEREEASYFSVLCDATPDISHTEQNVVLIKYVIYNNETHAWEIIERFLEFKNFHKKNRK